MTTISQTTVDSLVPIAQVGQKAYVNDKDYEDTLINSKPQAKAVKTATLSGVPANGTSTLIINGTSVSFTDDGTPSDTDSAAGLVAAINANPTVRGAVSATSALGVVTVTALLPGVDFTFSKVEDHVSLATVTAAAVADVVPFGRAVVQNGWDALGKTGGLPSGLGAQVDSYVLTYDDGVEIEVEVIFNGVVYSAKHTMATDIDTSGAAIATAINAKLPENSVLVAYTAASDTLTFTSEVNGVPFTSNITFGPGADTAAAVKTSDAGVANDLSIAFFGVSEHGYSESVSVAGVVGYPAATSVAVLRRGHIWVDAGGSTTDNGQVWVQLSTGKFFAAYASGYAALPKSKAVFKRYDSASGLSMIYVNALDQ